MHYPAVAALYSSTTREEEIDGGTWKVNQRLTTGIYSKYAYAQSDS